jgi:ribonucleoside-diphosphate reductase alpha chain
MKIKKITKECCELTVDIEVANTHTYQLSNGCVSHNTVSELCGTSPGLHTRYAQHYIRRVRVSKIDPIAEFLIDSGVPYHPEVGSTLEDCHTYVFEFPCQAPETSITRDELGAMDQLNYWMMLQKYWCEHKPSCTIYVKDHEWLEVGAWVYKNWNWVSGISFLPYAGGVYQLPPYEEIDEETYNRLVEQMPEIDFAKLAAFEKVDATDGAREFACTAGGCTI